MTQSPDEMVERTRRFATRCKRLCEALPNQPEAWHIRSQLSRSSDSVAANYRAALRSRSRKEFLAKLGVVEEEVDESAHWIETVRDNHLLPEHRIGDLLDESRQLTAIVVSTIKSARGAKQRTAHAKSEIRNPKSEIPRLGHGFDLHRLEPGHGLVVCGERLGHDRGCVADSDGDVVYHAVTDAILGALGQQDIGQLFPDDDAKWKGAGSSIFIKEAARRMADAGYAVGNLDITVILQAPRLSPHKAAMQANLITLLGCDRSQVNLKGKTHEEVDALGENRAIACHAVVLLVPV